MMISGVRVAGDGTSMVLAPAPTKLLLPLRSLRLIMLSAVMEYVTMVVARGISVSLISTTD